MLGGVVFFSCLFTLPQVMDFMLVPRFLVGSVALIFLIVLIPIATKQKQEVHFIFIVYFLYYLLNIFSASWAFSLSEALFESQKIIIGILIFFLTIFFLKQQKNFEIKLYTVIGIITSIYIFVSLIQIATQKTFSFSEMYNISSLNGNKNLFSSFLFLLLAFNLSGIKTHSGKIKKLLIVNSCLSIILIVILQTRAVWIALVVSIIIYGILTFRELKQQSKKSILIFIGILFIIGISSFLFLYESGNLPKFRNQLNITKYTSSESGRERLVLWKKTAGLIKEHPVIGCGAGNWQFNIGSQTIIALENDELKDITFQRPHNDFLWIWSETGTLGILLFLIVYLYILGYAVISHLKTQDREAKTNALFIAALSGYLVISFFDFPKERIEHLMFSNIVLAILFIKSKTESKKLVFQIRIPGYLKVVVISLLTLNLFIGVSRIRGEMNTLKMINAKMDGRWNDVIEFSDKAMSVFYSSDPMSMPVSWYRGLAYFHLKNYSESVAEFSEALSLNPFNKDILSDMGSAQLKSSEPEMAKKYYLEALRISPDFDTPKFNLAVIFLNEKKYEEALNWAKKLNNSHPIKENLKNDILKQMQDK